MYFNEQATEYNVGKQGERDSSHDVRAVFYLTGENKIQSINQLIYRGREKCFKNRSERIYMCFKAGGVIMVVVGLVSASVGSMVLMKKIFSLL